MNIVTKQGTVCKIDINIHIRRDHGLMHLTLDQIIGLCKMEKHNYGDHSSRSIVYLN